MALHFGNRGPGHLSRLFGAFLGIIIPPPAGAGSGQLVLNSAAKSGFTYSYGTM